MKVDIGPYKDDGPQQVDVHIDDWDAYSADYTLAYVIHPVLVKLKESNKGFPYGLTIQEWDEILDKMIYAFYIKCNFFDTSDACAEHCDGDITCDECKECCAEVSKKMKEGFELFGKYYEDLWW